MLYTTDHGCTQYQRRHFKKVIHFSKRINSKNRIPPPMAPMEPGLGLDTTIDWFSTLDNYLPCITRSRIDIPLTDQVVVTDIMVLSSTTKEFIPLDYDVVEYTADQNDLALHNHILLIKYQKKLETENAVSQIMFLGEEQVSCLPPKFSSVNQPINGCIQPQPRLHRGHRWGNSIFRIDTLGEMYYLLEVPSLILSASMVCRV